MIRFVKAGSDTFSIDADLDHIRSEHRYRDANRWRVSTIEGDKKKKTRFERRSAAYADFHRQIAERQAAGYTMEIDGVAVEAPTTAVKFAHLPDLETKAATIDDDAAWQALADAWTAAGDPRGDCILADRNLAGVNDPGLFVKHKTAGASARRVRGTHIYGALGADAYRVRIKLRRGLIERVELNDETGAPGRTTRELVEAIVASPFARFARELVVVDAKLDELKAATAKYPKLTVTVMTIE